MLQDCAVKELTITCRSPKNCCVHHFGYRSVIFETSSHSCLDNCCAYVRGQILQAGTVWKPWALFYVYASDLFSQTLRLEESPRLEEHHQRAMLPLQQSLAVLHAAQLEGSDVYALLLARTLHICISLPREPAAHSIPLEGFTDALAWVKRSPLGRETCNVPQIETYIQEHQCWFGELQQELVR